MIEFQVLLNDENQLKNLVKFININNLGKYEVLGSSKDGIQIEIVTLKENFKERILNFIDFFN